MSVKSMISIVAKEFKLVFRDGITIFLTVSPAVLALVFILVFGSMQKTNILLAADKNVPQNYITKLEAVADIELVDDLESLKDRVGKADSVAGVYVEDGSIKLLVGGDETEDFIASRQQLVSAALSADDIVYATEAVESPHSLAYIISISCVLLLALFLGGASMGLGGVGERESKVIRAISISPMSLGEYVISKLVPALLLNTIGVAACALIIGRGDALPQFLLLALCSVFASGIIIFLIISFAGNQIAAVGVLKIIMPVFLIIGISAIFVPECLMFLYYALPMYWQYAAINGIITGAGSSFPLLMILATSLPWFIAVMFIFTSKVKMKAGR